jgi:ABC-type multidrug transport system fused ATPase/permease subunit
VGSIWDGLDPEAYDRTYPDSVLIRRIVGYFGRHGRAMIVIGLSVMLASVSATAAPIVVSRGLDLLVHDPRVPLALVLALAVGTVGSVGWIFNYVKQILGYRVIGDVVLRLREDACAAVLQRDMSFYDEFPSGKIVSRVTSDTQDFATVVTLTMDLIGQLLLVVVVTVALVAINLELALLTIATTPLVVIVALTFRHVARWATRNSQRATANVNAVIQETIAGIGVAKSFRQEGTIYGDFRVTNGETYAVRLKQGIIFASIFPALGVITAIGTGTVVYFGAQRVLGHAMSVGDWYLFVQSLNFFYMPMASISSFWSQFQQGLAASERVFALIDAEPVVIQTAAEPVAEIAGRVTFDHLRFSYVEGQPVLPDFSLDVRPGETVALVGHTGAGKSSIVKLILRFYEFQGGRILVDGRDLRRLDLAEFRRHVGLVPQSPYLFSGTVADNIRYARPDASDAEVHAVAAHLAEDWVADLPEGLETDVGERGSRLSAGQRQLVALARVLLKDPAILILDEATASIDPLTEAQIQEGLDVVMAGRTSLVVAHRLSTIVAADRIVVLRDGSIIEEGSHEGLLAGGGHYAELYNTYFRHQSLSYKPWEADGAAVIASAG